MKQLIEEQKEIMEYMDSLYPNVEKWKYENYVKKITDWHKQSLKQFIDELIAREESTITEIGLLDDSSLSWTWDVAKKNTIAHLKKLKEELN